jgi:hypothetical protein
LIGTSNLALVDVPKSLEKTFTQVHVTNWVDAFWELDRAGKLAVSVAPLVLNTFQVPLVD